MIKINVTSSIGTPDELLRKFHLEKMGRAQTALDGAVVDFSVPYCPYRTGRLAYSPYQFSIFGSGTIEYNVPYARPMYYGQHNGKEVNYNRSINPLAGSYWTDRMKADRIADLVDVVRRAMRKTGGMNGIGQ